MSSSFWTQIRKYIETVTRDYDYKQDITERIGLSFPPNKHEAQQGATGRDTRGAHPAQIPNETLADRAASAGRRPRLPKAHGVEVGNDESGFKM